ncbi:hypothetical protein AgCh_039020 [Apium graveolens]
MEQELGQSSGVNKISPGFHFQPTALELLVHYLQPWVLGYTNYPGSINEHVDLYSNVNPDQLKGSAIIHRDEYMYFYTMVKRKHVNGKKFSRSIVDGQGNSLGNWKASQKGEEIKGSNGVPIGVETHLVYYNVNKRKTSWLMVEYKLLDNPLNEENREWTICKVYEGGRTNHE